MLMRATFVPEMSQFIIFKAALLFILHIDCTATPPWVLRVFLPCLSEIYTVYRFAFWTNATLISLCLQTAPTL